jgi:hypothetical protein
VIVEVSEGAREWPLSIVFEKKRTYLVERVEMHYHNKMPCARGAGMTRLIVSYRGMMYPT